MKHYDWVYTKYYWWLECPRCHEYHDFFAYEQEPKTVKAWCDHEQSFVEVEM